MFGTKKEKGPSRAEQRLAARVAELEAQNRALVAEKAFWQDQVVSYGNGVEFWQTKHRELLAQIAKEGASLDLRAYAQSIEQALLSARPDPSLIAGVIAMAGKDVQGVVTRSPEARALIAPREIKSTPRRLSIAGEAT